MPKPRANCFCLHFEGFTLRNSLVMQQSCFSSKIWGRMILELTSVKEFMQTMNSWCLQFKSQLLVSIWLYAEGALRKMAKQTKSHPHPTWGQFHKSFCSLRQSFVPFARLSCQKKSFSKVGRRARKLPIEHKTAHKIEPTRVSHNSNFIALFVSLDFLHHFSCFKNQFHLDRSKNEMLSNAESHEGYGQHLMTIWLA